MTLLQEMQYLKQGILLIPSIDNMKTRGIVWIQGVLTGMFFGGADPMEAAPIQMREEIGLPNLTFRLVLYQFTSVAFLFNSTNILCEFHSFG